VGMKNLCEMAVRSCLLCLIVSCGAEEIQNLTAESQARAITNKALATENETLSQENQALAITNKALATENETLNEEIDYLKKQDHYVLSQAGALLDDGDVPGALKAYQSFVRDFPSSSGVEVATKQISALQDSLKKTRLAEVAEQERQQLAAIRSLPFDELTSDKLIRQYLVGRWVAPDFGRFADQLGRGSKQMLEFQADGRVTLYSSTVAYLNAYRMDGYEPTSRDGELATGKYSITREEYLDTGGPYIQLLWPNCGYGGALLDGRNAGHGRLLWNLGSGNWGEYVRID
jgi:hypothetical protein